MSFTWGRTDIGPVWREGWVGNPVVTTPLT